MKIIQIGQFPVNPKHIRGGVEASVYGISKVQVESGNDVLVLDLPNREEKEDYTEQVDGIAVARYFSDGHNNLAMAKRLKDYIKRIKSEKPDVCHLHTTSLFCFLLYLFLRFYRIPSLLTVHGLVHVEQKNRVKQSLNLKSLVKYNFYSLVEFIFLSMVKEIIVDTDYVKQIISSYGKSLKIWHTPICHVISQGIDDSYFQLSMDEKIQNQILVVGAFSARKGYLSLLDAIKMVLDAGIKVKVFCCGFIAEPSYFVEMQKKRYELGLDDCVEYLCGLQQDEILKQYKRSTVFLLYSQEESQGIVLCEAMAAGLPIVATKVGGIPYVIEDEVNGLLSDYADVYGFSKNVIRLLKDNDLSDRISKNNRRKSLNYSWKTIEKDVCLLYNEMINVQ